MDLDSNKKENKEKWLQHLLDAAKGTISFLINEKDTLRKSDPPQTPNTESKWLWKK